MEFVENVPSNNTATLDPTLRRDVHSARSPVVEMSTSFASTPCGDRRNPVIEGT
jgi:hypothetical protein